MDAVERLGELLLAKALGMGWTFSTVLAPAMGGLVIGQEVARRAKARYIFCEKENDVLVMRRGFTLAPGESVLVVEDVVTRGGRVNECLEIVRKAGGAVAGVAMLVDRSAGSVRFDAPFCLFAGAQLPDLHRRTAAGGARQAPRRKAGELRRGTQGLVTTR